MQGRLPPATLAAYGSLALPLAALNLPLYVYLPTFYATELGLNLAVVGSILLWARLLDVVTDPVMGELGDRTRSRYGQRRPWILLATPLLIFATWRLFVPPEGAGALHLFVWSGIAYLAWTVVLLAYGAWGAELSGDYHERARIAGVREAFVIVGIIIAAATPAVVGVDPGSGASLELLFWLMAGTLVVTAGAALTLVDEPERVRPQPGPFLAGLKLALANRPFRRLVLAYLLNGAANGLPASLFLLFVQHVIATPAWTGPLLLLYFLAGIAAVPGWLALSRRFGKHRAWSWAMLWACAVFIWVPLLGPGDVLAFAVICVLSGLSLGADMALPAAMQADVVDLDRLESGRRRTGLFFAAWSMATKLSLAAAVGVAFPVLSLMGFDPNATNDRIALVTLATLYALVPVLIKLAAVALVWRFEIDAGRQASIRRRVEALT
jgi:GPH family glycoside/pentoside/hexuronide:cation symporter